MSLEWLNRLNDRAILILFFGGAVATSLSSLVVNLVTEAKLSDWGEGWLQNFSTELFGAFFGFWLLGMIVDKRRQQEAKQEVQGKLKQRLIREMGSKDNATAANAAKELQAHGWLRDGSLINAWLHNANLQGTHLEQADLEGASLSGANLQEARFNRGNLSEAHLWHANLRGAILYSTDLSGADLMYADLAGAYLSSANLEGANLKNAKFDENTRLPDDDLKGKSSFWTPNTDMTRFTHLNHPDFWRSDNPGSPAYRSDAESSEDASESDDSE